MKCLSACAAALVLTLAQLLLSSAPLFAATAETKGPIRVSSKTFTENIILGEIIAQIAETTGEATVDRKLALGTEAITYFALKNNEIDVYPEYSGTLAFTLIKDTSAVSVREIRARLAGSGLTVSDPIGFSNTSALAVTRGTADRLNLRTLSDLAKHPELTAAFGAGYLDREDSWPGLSRHYGLKLANIRIIEHALKYQAVSKGEVDVIDIYSTDGKLQRYDLQILEDDKQFFPDYLAVLFAREEFVASFPVTWKALNEQLIGQIDDRRMSELNALADLDGYSPQAVAKSFLSQERPSQPGRVISPADIGRHALSHLYLVLVSVGAAILTGVPLGIFAARFRALGTAALMSVEVVQTIPSLALLVFMIPLFGIGVYPALVALYLYALLPIVRNTYTGMRSLDRELLEMAGVLGLSPWQTLRRIELPLASMSILSGIKTSAVITVGTATLAAFIGGGGLGTLIVRGLALNDTTLILAGAIPAAILALLIHVGFDAIDRVLVPRGLRISLARG